MDIYNSTLQEIIPLFALGTYCKDSEERLQKDFSWLLDQNIQIETKLAPEQLDPKRVKVCQVCGDIFYATGKKNKQTICNNKPYVKYKKDGTPFRSSGKKSACQMEYQRRRYKRL